MGNDLKKPSFISKAVANPNMVNVELNEADIEKKITKARKQPFKPIHAEIEPELYDEVRVMIFKKGKTVKSYIRDLIVEDLINFRKTQQ